MLQIININKMIDFMRWSKSAFILSSLLVTLSIYSLAANWLNWGLDFTGGTLVDVTFKKPIDLDELRLVLENNNFPDTSVQNFGSARDVMIRMRPQDSIPGSDLRSQVIATINDNFLTANSDQSFEINRIELVGPNVGDELAQNGILAIFAALVCILLYISMRFEWRLAAGAVLSLAHDVIITLGIFSFLQIEVDLTIVAALLTVVGYSLNDTIVVFDRIRENFRKKRNNATHIINASITETLSRTLISSATTLFVVISLFVVGGSMIHGFATALLLGITIGTYSSIYIASALSLRLGLNREHLLIEIVEKEGA